jgi:hypothetical protein
MPADALFEMTVRSAAPAVPFSGAALGRHLGLLYHDSTMSTYATHVADGPGAAPEDARLGRRPLHGKIEEGGLKPAIQWENRHSERETISTTRFRSVVVENSGEKQPLKVLVESLLLAFRKKCRRADIFHRNKNPPASDTVFRANSANPSRFSAVFCSGRLLRRSATSWTSSTFTRCTNFFVRSEGALPSRQDSSQSFPNPNPSEAYRDKVGLFFRCRQSGR